MVKYYMRQMGLSPDRCNDYDNSKAYKNKVYCNCQTHHVSTRMYNLVVKSIKTGLRKRHCTKCKTNLRLEA